LKGSRGFGLSKMIFWDMGNKRGRESVCYECSHCTSDGSSASPTMRVGPSKSARRAQTSNHLKRLGLRAPVVSVKEKAESNPSGDYQEDERK